MRHTAAFAASTILDDLALAPRGYLLVRAHREENVDSPARMGLLLDCLEAAHHEFGLPVVASAHPQAPRRTGAADPGWARLP